MQRVELFSVQDIFQLGSDVVVLPDFSVPGGWNNITAQVTVVKPDGNEFEAGAYFGMSHFSIRDPHATIDQIWRVVVRFQGRRKDEFPIGSKIMVTPDVKSALTV